MYHLGIARHYTVSTRAKDDSARKRHKVGKGSWRTKARKTARCKVKRRIHCG